jgi:thiol-disulfide isomerase/thioredoxin
VHLKVEMASLGRALTLTLLLIAPDPGRLAQTQANAAEQPPFGEFIPASRPLPVPQVGFTDMDGKAVSLSDFAGKLVLVNFWATWCAPCRREMPSLERLGSRLGDKITILAISEDIGGSKAVTPYIAKLGLRGVKIYLDPHNKVGHAFNVDGLPTSFLIDRQGRVLGRVEGEAEWDSPRMLAIIDPLLLEDEVIKTSFPQARP